MDDSLVFDRISGRAVDRDAVERYGIPGIVLMENAARGLLDVTLAMKAAGPVVICCGPGNNGGDGYAMGRHLDNRGVEVLLVAIGTPRPGTDAAVNREICVRMGLRCVDRAQAGAAPAGLLVDAILGTGLDRPVHGETAEWIDWLNGRDTATLAVDVPSGLDCDTGAPLGVAVRADRTATMVGWKPGFLAEGAAAYTGDVVVVDIGAPRRLLVEHGRPRSSASRPV
jgi:NAD(P)H-hydrate epimerase